MTTAQRLEELRAQLRERGLRATTARVQVLAAVLDAEAPVSHLEVSDALGELGVDQATVFRNLSALVKAGLLVRKDHGDHVWRFEPVDHATHDEAHPHFLCTECGQVSCMPEVRLALPTRSSVPDAVRRNRVQVQLRGVCDSCA